MSSTNENSLMNTIPISNVAVETIPNVLSVEADIDDNILDAKPEAIFGGRGPRGYSAYEIAVKNGFAGSQVDWLKSLIGEDGHTPVKGVDYFDGEPGEDGYTPVKGVDYFDGEPGEDGYTPVKGVDYFDGEPGEDGYTPVKGVDYFDGEDGYTPVKGVDYFDGKDYILTETDKSDIAKTASGLVDLNWGNIKGTLANQKDLNTALNNRLDKTDTKVQYLGGSVFVGSATSTVGNAYTHMRKVVPMNAYDSKRTVTGAAFAVGADGTATFQHKSYNDSGAAGRNEAVLRFYPGHIQFATNTTPTNVPAETDYKDLATQEWVIQQINNALGIATTSDDIPVESDDQEYPDWMYIDD